MLALHNNASPSLLVEADPVGSSPTLAGFMQGQVRHDKSLVNLAAPHTHGRLSSAFDDQLVPLTSNHRVKLLPGLVHSRQTQTVAAMWPALADHLGGLSTHDEAAVVIDAGRVGHVAFPRELVVRSDTVLVFIRPERQAVAAAKSTLPVLRAQLEQSRSRAPVGLVVVGRTPYSASDVSKVLGLPVAFTLAFDRKGARQYSEGLHLTKFTKLRSPLLQSTAKLWSSTTTFAATHKPDWLATTEGDTP